MTEKVIYSIIIPVYNEQEVIQVTYQRLKNVMDSLKDNYELIFVNDGSRDETFEIIQKISETDNKVKIIDFSRNFGHQIAITAGMDFASGQAVVVIDADLQDPPEAIIKMIEKWKEGYEVVYAKRIKRKGDSLFKRITAAVFYRFLRRMTNVDIPVDAGDFRLIDRKVCDALKNINEQNRYVRGVISWLGFKQTAVEIIREKRYAGVTKYPLKKMLKFAVDAVTSFSYKPLRLASYTGIIISFFSFLYLLIVIYQKLFTNTTYPGWASILAVSLMFNGVILIIMRIMGEYIGRIYEEVKRRPLYVIRDVKNFEDKGENYFWRR